MKVYQAYLPVKHKHIRYGGTLHPSLQLPTYNGRSASIPNSWCSLSTTGLVALGSAKRSGTPSKATIIRKTRPAGSFSSSQPGGPPCGPGVLCLFTNIFSGCAYLDRQSKRLPFSQKSVTSHSWVTTPSSLLSAAMKPRIFSCLQYLRLSHTSSYIVPQKGKNKYSLKIRGGSQLELYIYVKNEIYLVTQSL